MSGSQSFGVRLVLEGAQVVQSGLQQLQAAAQQSQQAVQSAGEAAGRSMVAVERGTQAASIALTKLGGDFVSLVPVVNNAGGAVAGIVTALGSGTGLLGVLGLAAGAVGTAIALYQNWDTAGAAVATSVDFLTGRVRLNADAITTANDRLREYLRLSESAAEAGVRSQVQQQQGYVAGFTGDLGRIDQNIAELERALGRARGSAPLLPESGLGAVRLRPDEQRDLEESFRRRGEVRQQDPAIQARIQQIEGDLRVARGERELVAAQLRQAQGTVAALGENAGTVINPRLDPMRDPNLPVPPSWQDPATRSAGGGVARQVNEALRERDALVQRNLTADERYSQGLERIASLNDRLIAQGNDPLPDEAVQREATRLMDEYEQATRRAANAQQNVADGSRNLGRLADGVGKTLAGGLEDFVFEGRRANDVLKDMERQLLRLGNQNFLEPLFKDAANGVLALLGGGQGAGGKGASGGTGGAGGVISNLLGSLFSSGGAASAAGTVATATQIYATAAEVGPFLFHEGGIVGAGGRAGPQVPLSLFAGAPRYHSGGIIGPDERPIIAKVGETIRTQEQEAALRRGGGPVQVTLNVNGVRDISGFRESHGQITNALARALGRSGRNR